MSKKYYLQGILTGLMIFSVALLSGCTKANSALYPPNPNSTDNKTVYIVNHGIHTGIILPQNYAGPYMRTFDDFKNAKYLEIGWGDETYYQSKVNTLWMGIKALFLPTNSVLHVAALQTEPIVYFAKKEVLPLKLSNRGFIRLVEYIDKSFSLNENNQTIKLQRGLYGKSRFYSAEGIFHLLNTCNTWSAKAIHSSGFPINPYFTFTAENIMYQLKQDEQR